MAVTVRQATEKFDQIGQILNFAAVNHENVLLRGEAGVGKTQMIREIADSLGLSLKYFSASTLDPYSDLVGIPVPTENNKNIQYLRSEDIEHAEFLFFDELNRAHRRITNAVLEIVQFRTINGTPLPKLKMIWAAVNPSDSEEYQTEALDRALVDRFDYQIDIPYQLSPKYFGQVYGDEIASVSFTWWNALSDKQKSLVSPRRLDKIISIMTRDTSVLRPYTYMLFENSENIPLTQLAEKIRAATSSFSFGTLIKDPSLYKKALETARKAEIQSSEFNDLVSMLCTLDEKQCAQTIDILLELPDEFLKNVVVRADVENFHMAINQALFVLHQNNEQTIEKFSPTFMNRVAEFMT